MKNIFCAMLLLVAFNTQAQKATSGLIFCTSVNEQFQPVNPSAEITLQNNQAALLYYYWDEKPFATSGLVYKTFSIDKKGKETLSATIRQTVEKNWRMVKQSARFTNAGTYRVKVYTAEDKELAASTLTVK